MLVRVTEKCHMNCIHCSVNACPEGEHMDLKTYDQTLRYLKNLEMPIIMLTGGEPTSHPDIIEMINRAKNIGLMPALLSNGTFLEDETLKKEIIQIGINIQITNDPRYYPKEVPIIQHPNITYEHQLRVITPFGRAIKNELPITSKAPNCFNLRSLCRNSGANSLSQVMMGLAMMGKMCTPSVNIDGTISAGEQNSCHKIGKVTDDLYDIFGNITRMKCINCKLVYKLTNKQKKAIGEMW